MIKLKLGQRVRKKTANGLDKVGHIVYIHKAHRWYTVEFTGMRGQTYRESFNVLGGD